jgi:thiol-disulfide isomerase/thioredoxin
MSRYLLLLTILIAALLFFYFRSRQPRFVAGAYAPDFQVVLSDGAPFSLSDLKGRYVLLQFWGSWCGPCRQENPQIVSLYNQFHEKGFEVVSIGLETQEDRWRQAIKADRLLWPYHSADMQRFKGGVASLYNIHAIPTTFLINPEGMIMGVSLSPSEMQKMLTEKLGKN